MGLTTDIQWCDSTINPTSGCDGCELKAPGKPGTCYAVPIHVNRLARTMPDKYAADFHEVHEIPGRMNQISKWSDLRGKDRPDKPWLNGMPRTIFVGDLGDLFSRDVTFEFIRDELVAIAGRGGRHIQMWLTKQPQRMHEFSQWLEEQSISWPDNIWAGVSATTQKTADLRIPQLLQVPAKVRFLSMEPQLEEIDLKRFLGFQHEDEIGVRNDDQSLPMEMGLPFHDPWVRGPDWVIQGGESGPKARPFNLAWARKTRDQCKEAGVAYFLKQLGSKACDSFYLTDQRLYLKDSHGGDMSEWPEDLRVREIPEVAHA